MTDTGKRPRIPLTQLLHTPASDAQTVAVANGMAVSWLQLRQRVGQWQQQLAGCPATTVAVWLQDSLEFAAALLALWHSGKVALLCGDRLPATVELAGQQAGALLGDFETSGSLPLIPAPDTNSKAIVPATAISPLDPEQLAVVVLTSGTTGDPKTVPYRLAQLDGELAMHEQLFGLQAGTALVAGTVSHQHIYGLLWRVLWPLTGQRPLLSECCHYPEDLLVQAQHQTALILVTTPTHLTRLPASLDWSAGQGESPWRLVVSSTAPLSLDASRHAGRQLGCPVTEIYGSSETGGIAWRRQTDGDTWQPLPGIEVRGDTGTGALQLRSPLFASNDWFTTGDRAEVTADGGFRLLGRLDRIAKIEGKRVSLSGMEQQLQQHPWLAEVAVLVLDGHRTTTAVAASLSADGTEALQRLGKANLCRQLRQWLGHYFETPVLPRRWRFVDQLPRNPQGKLPLAALQALFMDRTQPDTRNRLPELLGTSQLSDYSWQIRLKPTADLIWFDGHFPDTPILPGVVQVQWAAHFGSLHCGTPLAQFARLEVIKFQQVMRPDREAILELNWNRDNGKLSFRYFHDEKVFSSGRLVFDLPGEPARV